MIRYLCNTLFVLIFVQGSGIQSATVFKTLYINRGQLITVNFTSLPAFAFNSSTQYSSQNAVLSLTTNDVLILKIVNNDSVTHGFDIKRYANANAIINPKDSLIDTLKFNSEGLFIYYDSYQNPKYRYLGAAGMITILNSGTDKRFYWNLKEHQSTYSQLVSENKNVDWSDYTPDYFTINGYSFIDVLDDTLSRVHGKIGDTIHVFITNTGQSAHVMHFHGFHGKTIFSSITSKTGWVKDSFPLNSMETMIIELVPDKTGFYSVHDHNLMAITAGGIYQKGMLTLMHFE